jgi:hypothetical protein
MTKSSITLFGILFFFYSNTFTQSPSNTPKINFVCGHPHPKINLNQTAKFTSNKEAELVVERIMDLVGLRPNFKVQPARVPNAAAIVYGTDRYLLYSPRFISKVTQRTNTDWAAISIMAHEIGHHLSGHTLKSGGSRPMMELEADEFSGFILRKMGANLQEAQAAVSLFGSPIPTNTHPGKNERLEAIQKGWNRANNISQPQENKVNRLEIPMPPRVMDPNQIMRKVVLINNSARQYFITTQHEFITIINQKVFVLGNLKTTKEEPYPFRLTVKNAQDLKVNEAGELFTESGNLVGFMIKPN